MTNGEYLRSLSDEELGKRLCDLFGGCNVCVASEHCSMGHNGIVAWIKEESDVLPFDRQNSQMTCKDCVSRQAAIDAANRADYRGLTVEDVKKVTDEVVKEIKKLPSAQSDNGYSDGFTDGYKRGLTDAQPDNQINLCDSCDYSYPDCPSESDDVIFGNGIGNDNICACNKYKPSAQPEIVRCKDCKHRPIIINGHAIPPKEDDEKCPFLCDDYFYSRRPGDNFFCANAERTAE